jgi:hypothetical protein
LNHSLPWVYGATGHAFILNVSEDLCPSGPTTWEPKRFYQLGRNLGYETKTVHGHNREPDFGTRQKEAWELCKLAINAGFPCYGWDLLFHEYYVIYGYDQNHYYFRGPGVDTDASPKLWMELGDTEIGVIDMHAVSPLDAGISDDLTTVRQALEFAVQFPRKWVSERAKAGPRGYDNWIAALKSGNANSLGAAYNAAVWHECRRHAVEFLAEAMQRLNDLSSLFTRAISFYETVRDSLKLVTELFPFEGMVPEHVSDAGRCQKAGQFLNTARDAEAEGLEILQEIIDAM